jgi:hypothetical protein
MVETYDASRRQAPLSCKAALIHTGPYHPLQIVLNNNRETRENKEIKREKKQKSEGVHF